MFALQLYNQLGLQLTSTGSHGVAKRVPQRLFATHTVYDCLGIVHLVCSFEIIMIQQQQTLSVHGPTKQASGVPNLPITSQPQVEFLICMS